MMMTTATKKTYAYSTGFEAGSGFLDPEPSLLRVRAHALDQMAQERRDAQIALAQLELRRDWRAKQLGAADDRYGNRSALVEELTDLQDEKPSAYSRVRGFIYIGFAVLILIADFAILAQVISRIFGFTARAKGLGDPASALFRDFPAAMEAFGEVYLTTIGVLLIAMAFKVWNDRAPRKPLRPDARLADRIGRFFEDHTQWVVLAVAVLAVVVIAFVRVRVDMSRAAAAGASGAADPEVMAMLRWVTAIIGLACPIVGVLLFSRGLEALGAGQRLKSLARTAEGLEKKASKIRTEWEGHTQDQIDKQIRKEFVDRDETERHRLKIAEDQFRLGYAAGVTAVLRGAGPRGAYRGLRLRFPTR
jgi:hypothetical protein